MTQLTSPEIPFYRNALLFGHDQTPGLITFELQGSDAIRIYRRQGQETTTALEPFSPFLLLADPDLLNDWTGEADVSPLDGAGFYRWLARIPSWASGLGARDHCQKVSRRTPTAPDRKSTRLNSSHIQKSRMPSSA